MPKRSPAEYREYMRRYMKKQYHRIRNAAVEQLGGCCTQCGATEQLEIDHVNRAKKTMSVERICYVSEERRQGELKNCQLLCNSCHARKTLKDLGRKDARLNHDTLSSYRYCKCDKCKMAKRKYNQEYRKRRSEAEVVDAPDF